MPGLFGIIDTGKGKVPINASADAMRALLMHKEYYQQDVKVFDDGAMGVINVRQPAGIHQIQYRGSSYFICIDGNVYTIGGMATDSYRPSSDAIIEYILKPVLDAQYLKLTEIEGNYVIGVYDEKRRSLTIFNDIIAPRKLYYALLPEGMIFSCETKAISGLPFFQRELDDAGIADFFNYGYVLGERTLFQKIMCMPSATVIKYEAGTGELKKTKYWHPRYSEGKEDPEKAADECNDLLLRSIDEKSIDGQKIICPISGGLDSRIILSNLSRTRKQIDLVPVTHGQTFSYEYRYGMAVCRRFGISDPILIDIRADALLDKYEKAVWLSEGMIGMSNAHLLLHYDRLGDQYDSFFNGIYGGPTNYDALYFGERHLYQDYRFDQKAEDIRRIISVNNALYDGILDPQLSSSLKNNAIQSIESELEKCLEVSDRFCNQRDAFFIENRMRKFICQSSLTRYFWEEHLPLSNYKLYAFYLNTKPELKLGRKLLKTMIKRRFPEVADIPDANTGLPMDGHRSWIRQRLYDAEQKARYYLPKISKGRVNLHDRSTYSHYPLWLRTSKPTAGFFRKYINESALSRSGLIERNKGNALLDRVLSGGDGFEQLLRIVTFSIWYEQFIERV